MAETCRQRDAYRALAVTLEHTVLVDASQSLNDVVADVERAIHERLTVRGSS